MYARPAATSAIAIITKPRFRENFASAAECVMDSNPTYAQGASAKTVRHSPGMLCPGIKEGPADNVFPGLPAAATKQMTIPAKSSTAITI